MATKWVQIAPISMIFGQECVVFYEDSESGVRMPNKGAKRAQNGQNCPLSLPPPAPYNPLISPLLTPYNPPEPVGKSPKSPSKGGIKAKSCQKIPPGRGAQRGPTE